MNKRELDRNIDLALMSKKKPPKRVVLAPGDLLSILQHLHNFNYEVPTTGPHVYRGVELVCSEE